MKRALLSVTDKSGLEALAGFLQEQGVEMIASGGTRAYLEERGFPVQELAAYTGQAECLGGRVKTLHPRVFGGILADPALHAEDLQSGDFPLIDLLVVNLYRFREAASDPDKSPEDIIESIDIGGPSLLRAAAKNHARVSVLCDPGDYASFMEHCRKHGGRTEDRYRRSLAARAFAHTRDYDIAIAEWFEGDSGDSPVLGLRYGENPHQAAWLHFGDAGGPPFQQVQGKELSYNNYLDLSAALDLLLDLQGPAAVILKHSNPCGVGFADTGSEALRRAWSSDPVSAFGSVIAMSETLDLQAAEFIEVLLLPSADEEALKLLSSKKNLRILLIEDISAWRVREVKRSVGPLLLRQEADLDFASPQDWTLATGKQPGEVGLRELDRAWRVVKHVKSNAVLIWKGNRLLAAGAGQMSRLDSCRIAVDRARELGHEIEDSVAASDAFFPFPDGLEILAEAGVKRVIQPGGSIRDEEVLKRAEELGITVLLTGRRHFRH
ncbi:MAG: bifunctional phosphoribosylaminoimidazolecarboxamide formyltransferase/IMP cyclohydrolase [Candidatus Krumholzibacteria bacterium]|nr:bifunctional phosphoribosylaminoimidazolecarboxamide formyltransferase/IMP cyclohydrolase [Candidatus Krumholzibacteria bacterium]